MTEKPQRIGLWGGSFNPPTLAHKALADFVFSALSLDRLIWVVAPHNPEKDPTTLAPFAHRVAMVDQVLENEPQMTSSDIEQRNGSSWTIDTVKTLRKDHPDDTLIFIMGTDNWLGFHGWGEGFDKILHHVSIVILNRPGYDHNRTAQASGIFQSLEVSTPEQLKKAGSWCLVDNPLWDMAATRVRQAILNGEVSNDVAPATMAYIHQYQLYENR